MTSQFLIAFWDDQPRWDAKIRDVLAMTELGNKHGYGPTGYTLMRQLDAVAYCFGDDCESECRKHHVRTVRLADDRTYVNECQYFRRKFLAMHAALETVDECLLLDIDTVLRRPLPADFWERMRRGADIQVPLQRHKRPKAYWRPDHEGRQHWASAAYIYCRSRTIIERLIQIMDEHDEWWEETALAYGIDELMGGWQGADEWIRRGYHASGVKLRTTVGADEDAVFGHIQLKCALDTGLRF